MSEYQIQQIDKLINTLNKSVRQIEFLEKLDEYMGGANKQGNAPVNRQRRNPPPPPGSQKNTTQKKTYSEAVSPASLASPASPAANLMNPGIANVVAPKGAAPASPSSPVPTKGAAPASPSSPVANLMNPGIATVVAGTPSAPSEIDEIKRNVTKIKGLLNRGTGGPTIDNSKMESLMENTKQFKGSVKKLLNQLIETLESGTNNDEVNEINAKLNTLQEEMAGVNSALQFGGELKQLEYQL